MARYLMTHSLLSSWMYCLKENPYEDATTESDPMGDFLKVLRREPTETTEAMAKGIEFENLVDDIVNGFHDKTHNWYDAAKQVADRVRGGVPQMKINKEITVNGFTFVLHGRLDWLKAGEIVDVKYTGKYESGKFFTSTQHPMYFELVPEANSFTYLASNGSNVWPETYRRDEAQDIKMVIANFLDWLVVTGHIETYKKHWEAR